MIWVKKIIADSILEGLFLLISMALQHHMQLVIVTDSMPLRLSLTDPIHSPWQERMHARKVAAKLYRSNYYVSATQDLQAQFWFQKASSL